LVDTNSRRNIGGGCSVSIDVGSVGSYLNALMTINFSSRERWACDERSKI